MIPGEGCYCNRLGIAFCLFKIVEGFWNTEIKKKSYLMLRAKWDALLEI